MCLFKSWPSNRVDHGWRSVFVSSFLKRLNALIAASKYWANSLNTYVSVMFQFVPNLQKILKKILKFVFHLLSGGRWEKKTNINVFSEQNVKKVRVLNAPCRLCVGESEIYTSCVDVACFLSTRGPEAMRTADFYLWGGFCCLLCMSVSHCCLRGCFKVGGHAGRTGRKVCTLWLISPLAENTSRRSTHFTHCSYYCVNNISSTITSHHCLNRLRGYKYFYVLEKFWAIKLML